MIASRLLTLVGLFVLVVTPASTQPAAAPQPSAEERLMMHFYTDPQPMRLVGFLERYEKKAQGWQPFPPVAGFLAIVFRQQPDWIGKLIPDQPDSRTAVAIAAALRLSGEPAIEPSLQSRLANAGADPSLRAELANLPLRLEELHVVTPTHLDVLRVASFASGDERYARMVADFLAETANRSELIAIDGAKTELAMAGGPREILSQLKDKYGEQGARQILFASAAAWGLISNAQQQPFIDTFLTKHIAANSGSGTAKILSALRPRKRS
jgi:hypothetical protein